MLPHTAQVPLALVTPSVALPNPSAVLMSNIDCTTYLQHFFRPPCDILGLPPASALDAESVRRRFLILFEYKRQGPAAQDELQTLCLAFLLIMMRVSPPQTQVVTNNIAVQSAQINLNMDARCNALRQHAAELEMRLRQAQQENAWLQRAAQAAHRQAQSLQSVVLELQAQLDLARRSAHGAPPYTDLVISFLRCRCVQGDDNLFVGSAELHTAFLAFLKRQHQGGKVQPPSQRALRGLLEHMGYEYRQTWAKGANVRGFRRLALREPDPAWQGQQARASGTGSDPASLPCAPCAGPAPPAAPQSDGYSRGLCRSHGAAG